MGSVNKVYPHSLEAEMAVLGSMLISKDSIDTVSEILKPEHFYGENNKIIYEAIISLHDRKKAVDLLTVSEELKKTGKIEQVGGTKYIADLIEAVSTPAHNQNYAKIVKEKYILRELIKTSTQTIEKAYDQAEEIDAILDFAQKSSFEISQKNTEHGFADASSLAHDYTDNLSKLYANRSGITGVPSGFSQFDDATGGFQNSEFIILAARPSQGKTALALNIAYHVAVEAQKKIPVVFFSLEMDKMSLVNRMICAAAGINVSRVRYGKFSREDFTSLTGIVDTFSKGKIWIDDTPGLTIMDIRSRARKLMLELKAKDPNFDKMLVIIDYLQLIRGRGKIESRQQEVSEISRLLKDMARTLNVPVLALSQLNRKTEDKTREGNKPQLSDLRESGSLEQDADVVAMIHRDHYYTKKDEDKNKATLIIAKNRNGAVKEIELGFIPEFTRFHNPVPKEIEQIAVEETPL
ncbi:MAG: replicative DNA helicase [Elusimicrobiota bacterium]